MVLTDDELDQGVPYFLEKLKLADDADSRAIRRAYAREVKLLDQEHQAAEFQALRECYEGESSQHCVRSCWCAARIGRRTWRPDGPRHARVRAIASNPNAPYRAGRTE
jgi:hypothetical protein